MAAGGGVFFLPAGKASKVFLGLMAAMGGARYFSLLVIRGFENVWV